MAGDRERYDYVVVGAGSAGCVLANRLSADADTSVLVLEAGPHDDDRRVRDPSGYSELFGTERDWQYRTVPQSGLDGRSIPWPRGKTIGGTSSMNAMIYFRGGPGDYDRWAAHGNDGWGWDGVLPHFEALENAVDVESPHRGTGGPLHITKLDSPNEISRTFIEAGQEYGYPVRDHFNGLEREGVGLLEVTEKDGQRHSAADAYLKPALDRPNLDVATGARVTRLRFDGRRVIGVRYVQDGTAATVETAREVVLCAGAVNSPKLLLMSGVGPGSQLRRHDIPVVANRPGVGRNLQDHLLLWVNYETTQPTDVQTNPDAVARSEAAAVFRSSPGLEEPDLLISAAPGYRPVPGREPPSGHAFGLAVALLRPESQGQLTLASADPYAAPVIDPEYLSASADRDKLVWGLEHLRELAYAEPFEAFRGRELTPWEGDPTEAELDDYVRSAASTFWHPLGTCRMGEGERAVVDQQLRVYGVDGLRVVDASVMPTTLSAATNAPTIMLAEKVADSMTGASRG